jgi:hypothetical protein
MTDINLNVKVKGREQAKQDLASLANAVDSEAERLIGKERTRAKKDGAPEQREHRVLSTAIGTAIGNAVPKMFGAFNQSIAQAFDPNLSPAEKQLNIANAMLDLIPFGGGTIPKAILKAETQEIIGGAQSTGARINQMLGPAFQASGDLDDDAFRERFEPIIRRLRETIEPQERSRERGSQLIAENLTSFLEEFRDILSGIMPTEKRTDSEIESARRQLAETQTTNLLLRELIVMADPNSVVGRLAGVTE